MPGQQSTRTTYDYFAFISYSRRDEKWAKWLQQKLEQYRLPAVLYKELESIPKAVRPIFRDRTDLTTGRLRNALHKELDVSKKLILISSPHSARSEWVNKEVQRFIDSGRYEDIIPFIVAGMPNGGEDECFPEALHTPGEEQLLGISVAELGRQDAFLRVVAGLLEIKFDQLKRRHEQRVKRRNIITAAMLSLFLTIAGLSGYKMWDYYTPHEAYFADYALRWGAPVGIMPLTRQEIAVRPEHYKIITQKGLAVKLVHANSAGTPTAVNSTEHVDRPMIALFYYRSNGTLDYVEYVDKNGKVLSAQTYTTDLKAADFQLSGENSSLQTLAAVTTNIDMGIFDIDADKSDIARHVFEYNEDGFVTKTIFMRDRRAPILDAEGIGGLSYLRDEYGRPLEIRYLGLNGREFAATKQNVAGKRYDYAAGKLIRTVYYNPRGEATLNTQNWAIGESEFDGYGKVIRQSFLGVDGTPMSNRNGFAFSRFEYDGRGNITGMAFFSTKAEPVYIDQGYASLKSAYDEQGNTVEEAYFGVAGEPVICIEGYASSKAEYDEHGNRTSWAFFGTSGLPVLSKGGYASLQMEYDERGNIVRQAVFGTDGEPVLLNIGFASNKYKYDERGNRVEAEFFGANGQPVIGRDGYASWKCEYDERGNMVRTTFFDTVGNLIVNSQGYASVEIGYNEGGNRVSWSYYDADGRPALYVDGYASMKYVYDERGCLIEVAVFGVDGKLALAPVTDNRGVYRVDYVNQVVGYAAKSTMEYDENGYQNKRSYFGVNGEPLTIDAGYHQWVKEYDRRGNNSKVNFFGVDGNPAFHKGGYAGLEMEFDEKGNRLSTIWLGVNGERVVLPDGLFCERASHDERGRLIQVDHYGADGNLMINAFNWATQKMEYDERGNVVGEAYFGTNGEPITLTKYGYASWKCEYDERGNNFKTAYFGVDNEPVCNNLGIYFSLREFNGIGEMINETFYDVDGRQLRYQVSLAEVVTAGQAKTAGVEPGDFVVSYGGWRYFDHFDPESKSPFEGLIREINVLRQSEKEVVLFRPSQSAFLRYRFADGSIGIGFSNLYINDDTYRAFAEAYAKYTGQSGD